MTLPLLRKRPTTRQNTPTSASGPQGAWVAPALLILSLAVPGIGPICGAERSRVSLPTESSLAANVRGGHAPWNESTEAISSPADDPPASIPKSIVAKVPPARRKPTARSAADKAASGAKAVRTVRKKVRRPIRPAAFEAETKSAAPESDVFSLAPDVRQFDNRRQAFDDRLEELPAWPHNSDEAAVGDVDATLALAVDAGDNLAQNTPYESVDEMADDAETRRARVRERLTRPFKQMKEIRPFFDYEPDGEQRTTDRCFNLCPRPVGADCPECEPPDSEGVPQDRLTCPECPVEIDLRETARLVGSVNDFPVRNFPHIHYCWEPTNLFSYPLYFEDHCLERYGHTRNYVLQAPFSVGLFCAQFVGLPYQMTIDPIAKKRYALGWYRPGQYVPYKYYQVPWNTEAALVEAGAIAGGYFLFAPGVGP